MRAIKYLLFFILLSLISLNAQNVMTSSPYSMFGVGEMESGFYGSNAAMGGVAIGMRGSRLINTDNPAALTSLDSCRLIAEVSVFGKLESYKSKGSTNDAFTGNLGRFAMAGRILPRWYMAAGVAPYSSVGYYFSSTQSLEGSPGSYYTSTFSGDGGLSKVYWSNAYRILPCLSAGVNMNFIFGNTTQSETQSTMSVSEKLYGTTFSADFGVQYTKQLDREVCFTLGAVYGLKRTISMERTKTVIDNSTSTSTKMKRAKQVLPHSLGIGTSLEYKKWTHAIDYMFRQYSSLTSSDSRVTFHDNHELRLGTCFAPGGYSSTSFWKRTEYKLGVDLSTPSMKLYNQSGYSWRINAGMGFPVANGRINAAIFYDRMKLKSNVLERNLAGITVTYTLSEMFHRIKL